MKKYYITLIAILILPLMKCSTVSAKTLLLTQESFDYDWYLQQYPDVLESIGTDQNDIWLFYTTSGESSGWYGRPAADSLSNIYTKEALDILYTEANIICDNYSSPAERAKAAHDWVCDTIDYDFSYSNYSLDDAVLGGESVCQGYAETYNLLVQLCGIESEIVTGVVDNGNGTGAHAWNKITINGQESYVDTTWDDFTYNLGFFIHDCFMISKEKMDWIHDGKSFHYSSHGPIGYR